MQKVKICHLVEDLGIGGLEKTVVNICLHINKELYDARIWCLADGGELARQFLTDGGKLEILNISSYHNLLNVFRLSKKLQYNKFHILHTHGYFAGTIGRLAGILAHTPVVINHVHTSYINLNGRNRTIEKFLSQFSANTICCSNSVKRFMAEYIGVDPQKLVTIYNGANRVDSIDVSTRSPRTDGQQTSIAVIASLVENKGHRFLFKAFASLCSEFENIELLVAGKGKLRPWLENYAAELKIKKHIKFLGLCDDIFHTLRSSDICVLPSIEREGLGLALIEAMACGKPVIGTRTGGIPEVIKDGVNGYLVEPQNVGQLERKLARLICDKSLRRDMGIAGRLRFEKLFTVDKMASSIDDLYQGLLQARMCRPLNVLYLHNKSEIFGGGEQSLLNLWKHIDKDRFRAFLVVPAAGSLSRRAASLGLKVAHIKVPKLHPRNVIRVAGALKRLLCYCKNNNIDIIHSYTPRNNFLAALIGKTLNIRVIWHERNLLFDEKHDLTKMFHFLPDYVLCNSKAVAARFRNGTRGNSRVRIILNGVDLNLFKPGPASDNLRCRFKPNGEKIVGLISGLSRRKMPEHFIEAGTHILRICPSAILMVIGGEISRADKGRAERLRALSSQLGIENRIVFTGFVENMAEIIRVIDVGVAVTEKEACSRAILEMMASGIPVVAYETGGNPELIENGKSGRLLPFGDTYGLAKAVGGLLEDDTVRNAMGRQARQRAEMNFDIERNARLIQTLYEGR
jgi:glycosyltransferase involved in cell wall biosynthesis